MIKARIIEPSQMSERIIERSQMYAKIPNQYGTYDHNSLINRDAEDSHPMGAITGLNGSLNSKVDKSMTMTVLEILDICTI